MYIRVYLFLSVLDLTTVLSCQCSATYSYQIRLSGRSARGTPAGISLSLSRYMYYSIRVTAVARLL